MKAVVLSGAFGLENLRVEERADPEPGPRELVLRMRAASLNYRDLMMVRGQYNPRQPLPLIPASDGVGEVLAMGPGANRFAVGDRVCPIFAQGYLAGEPTREKLKTTLGGPLDGTLTELFRVHEDSVVKAPNHLTHAEAACLPCAGVTAWNAIVTQGHLQPGQTLLTLGTGGVSIFALQIAKALGARVIVTSQSDEKLARARELGADAVVNYRTTPDWGKAVRELTNGRGVDHVIEVGGAGTLEQSIKAVRPAGTVSIIGALAGAQTQLNVLPVLMQNIRLQGVFVGHRESFEALVTAVEQNQLRPIVDRSFGLLEAPAAFAHMQSGSHFGKVCLDLSA